MDINRSLELLGGKLEILLILTIPILGVIALRFTQEMASILSKIAHHHKR